MGARVALDVAAMSVSAAVDAKKAQRWATERKCMTREKKCSPDQAAKYAGCLVFTCTIAAGRQGTNAPLHGFDMSPAQRCLVVDQVSGAQAVGPLGSRPHHERDSMGMDRRKWRGPVLGRCGVREEQLVLNIP